MTAFEKYKRKIDAFVTENIQLRRSLLKDLCYIPAPSGSEEKRAFYCLEYLKSIGADTAYIDDEKNVIFKYNCTDGKKATLICAHTDVVFPDLAPMPYIEYPANDVIKCPGIGDDTANVTAILLTVKFFIENDIKPEGGIIFLLDTREEVGGNGMTYFMEGHRDCIEKVIVTDSINWKNICDKVVARKDLRIRVTTAGGHAQHAFGSPNAIVVASKIIDKIYQINIPRKPRLVATYNVGIISGGTETNKIASTCEFDVECRSNDREAFEYLCMILKTCIHEENSVDHKVEVVSESVKEGAVNIDEEKLQNMIKQSIEVIRSYYEKDPLLSSATTSANIPMSMGIPAICLGSLHGGYLHSLDEYLRISSLAPGLAAAIGFAVNMTM